MKEIICLHIGQAGVQMGNAIWELLSTEHGINQLGILKEQSRQVECLDTFFSFSHSGKYVPRSIFVDLEATVIDEVRSGSYRSLFHPDRLISGPEDAASNFARGFFTVGKLLLGVTSHEIRKLLENATATQAVFIFRSLGGGTGSGLTSAIFDSLVEYPKLVKIEMPIYPSPTLSTATVEPYNCLLSEHFCMEDIDVGLLLDNEALYDICSKYLSISHASYNTINRLISQLTSSITASVRFENVMNCDITVLQTNLVPYPRIHFPLANFAPVLSESKASHEELSVSDLTRCVFEKENQMMKIDHSFGRFMSCSLLYRGDVSPYHVYIALNEIKRDKNIEFVDWCPTGFKVGINICPPITIPASEISTSTKNVTMLANTSAVGQAWQRLTHKFYLLYSKRSFVHWFVGEGMEECEFTESLYNVSALVKDYEEIIGDHESKPESNQQNKANHDKLTSRENLLASNDDHNSKTNRNDDNESEFGKSCVKYQVSISEPNTAEIEDATKGEKNPQANDDDYKIGQRLEEALNKSEDDLETSDFGHENENANQNCNVPNLLVTDDLNNCASMIESLISFKDQSLKHREDMAEKPASIVRVYKRKSSKKLFRKRIGKCRFYY